LYVGDSPTSIGQHILVELRKLSSSITTEYGN
jgi:hypothetical protein